MAKVDAVRQGELLSRLSSLASASGWTSSSPDDHTIKGTFTAIKARWFLGGRSVTNTFRCTLDSAMHEAHFQESAVEKSWGLPPPAVTVRSRSQYGARARENRVDRGVGGGGTLEFGRFRESVERAVVDAGWEFVYEVV